jgi:hypothetical protein
MTGPVTWFNWQLPTGKAMSAEADATLFPERPRLLDALHATSSSHPQAVLVTHHQAEVVFDNDHPDKDLYPCTKLVNRKVIATWSLDPERAQLWDILARHYFHASEVEDD